MTENPLKIALAHADLPNQSKGGVAHAVHHLGNHLVRRGHDVTMFTLSPAFEECEYQVRQIGGGAPLSRWSSYLFAFHLRGADFSGFDVIHAHGDNYLLRAAPQVRTFHGAARDELAAARSPQRKIKQLLQIGLEKRGARLATLCTGVSSATRARIPSVSRVVSNGVDLGRFAPGPKAENPAILFVGTLGGRKRGAWLAEIFARQILPRFPRAELWSVADAPLPGQNVHNLGRVSLHELAELYRRAHVFCLPSTYEGFGIPYIEAMASGTPVVASPNPGALEITENGRYGIIAPDAELGEALGNLLGDADARAHWAKLGLERAPLYSWDNVVAAYELVYCEAMAKCARL